MSRYRLFSWLTSVKAMIFLVIGLVALGVLGYTAYRIYQDLFRERSISSVVNLETNANVPVQMSLDTFASLKGTPYLMATITSQQNYRQSYYGKEASSIRNFLFFNASDKSAQKLLPNNNFLFLRHEKLGQLTPTGEFINKVQGIWYEVVTDDSNNDQHLTTQDQKTIAVSEASGANFTEVIRQVDQVVGTHQPDDKTFLVFYASAGNHFVTEINIPSLRAVMTQQLPSLSNH